jgi:AAA domain/DnaB-like helicase N terminal domain
MTETLSRLVIPAHDAQNERAVLGAALREDDPAGTLARILTRTRPEHFYLEHYRLIRARYDALAAQGRPVDVLTLTAALRDSGDFDRLPTGCLEQLFEEGPIPAHLDSYIDRLLDGYGLRRAHQLGLTLSNGHGLTSTTEVLAVMREALADLETIGTTAEPILTREGPDFTLVWPGDLRMVLTAIRVTKRGVEGELTIRRGGHRLHSGALNLSSGTARAALVRTLREAAPSAEWRSRLEETCARLTAAAREGEPIVELSGEAPLVTPDLVYPLLLDGQTTLLFADGDSGKSLLSVALAVAVASGRTLPGGLRARRQAPVLVLDWEGDRESWDGRLRALCAGLGMDVPEGIHYRRMTNALADDVAVLSAEAARLRVGLVIIDSLAPACGPEPEGADAVVRTLTALRLFALAARLVLAHVSKADADRREGAKPFGSVFAWNLPRSVWEIRRDPDPAEPGLTMALHHRKNNTGPKHAPLGLRFAFGPDTITPYPVNLAETPQLTRGVSLSWRIRTALGSHGRLSTAALAENLDADPETVARTLRRLRHEGKVDLNGGGTWGLKAS